MDVKQIKCVWGNVWFGKCSEKYVPTKGIFLHYCPSGWRWNCTLIQQIATMTVCRSHWWQMRHCDLYLVVTCVTCSRSVSARSLSLNCVSIRQPNVLTVCEWNQCLFSERLKFPVSKLPYTAGWRDLSSLVPLPSSLLVYVCVVCWIAGTGVCVCA